MHNEFHNKNNYYLQITSLFFLFGVIYFFYYSKKNMIECILALILSGCFILSELFWNNPVRFSNMHTIDGIYAKITSVSFILYSLFKKMNVIAKFSYIGLMLSLMYTFYYSNLYSSMDWCCDEHIFYHGLMHLIGFIGISYAFYPA